MNLMRSALALLTNSVRSRLFSKQTFILCAFVLIIAGSTKYMDLEEDNIWENWANHSTSTGHLILFLFSALLYSCPIVRDEFDNKTITYLFIRPVPKWLIAICKVLGATLLSCIPVFLFLLLHSLILNVSLHAFLFPLFFQQLFLCTVFCLMAFALRHPILWAIVWMIMFPPEMPGSLKLISLTYHQQMLYTETFRQLEKAPLSNEILALEVSEAQIQLLNQETFPVEFRDPLSQAVSQEKKRFFKNNLTIKVRVPGKKWLIEDQGAKHQYLMQYKHPKLHFFNNTLYLEPESYFPETSSLVLWYGTFIGLVLIMFMISHWEFKLGIPTTPK